MRLSAKSSSQQTSRQTKNRSVHLLDRRPERLVRHLLFQNLAPQRAHLPVAEATRLGGGALNKEQGLGVQAQDRPGRDVHAFEGPTGELPATQIARAHENNLCL